MQKLRKIILKISVIITLSLCIFSFAYALDDYTVLAPLPGTTKCPNGSTPAAVTVDKTTGKTTGGCQTDFSTYLPGLFNLLIGVAAVLAFIEITYGGIAYMTTDAISGKGKSRERIENALWGLLLVIGSWVILNTINPNLLNFNLNMATPQTQGQDTIVSGATASGADLLSGATLAADTSNRNSLAQEGINVNNPPCTASKTQNCTNVDILTPAMISSLGTLKSSVCSGQSSCSITITGGDEGTLHNTGTTHGNGSTVDLSPTGVLNSYLGNTNPANGTKISKGGMTFTYETPGATAATTGSHWHVTKP